MDLEEIPIAYELRELPKPENINIAIVEGQHYDHVIILGIRKKINEIREKYFTYIIFLSIISLCIFSYVFIIISSQ